MGRLVIVPNKSWEADPLVTVFSSSRSRPAAVSWEPVSEKGTRVRARSRIPSARAARGPFPDLVPKEPPALPKGGHPGIPVHRCHQNESDL